MTSTKELTMTNEPTPPADPSPPVVDRRRIEHQVMQAIDRITELAEAGAEEITGLHTGFHDYDRMTCGLQPGQLTLVSGAAGSGKTAFVLNIAEHVAGHEGLPVVIFSFRTSAQAVTQRLIASQGRIDSHHLRIGALRDDEWKRLVSAVDAISKWSLLVDDGMAHTLESMRKSTMKLSENGARPMLVVVDGLGWIDGTEKLDALDRWTRMDQIARGLKALAREANSHVLLTCDFKKHATDFPWVGDLYGPSTLTNIADVVTLIYRPEQFNRTMEPGVGYVVIARQEGPVGMLKLTFLKSLMKFEEPASEVPSEEADA